GFRGTGGSNSAPSSGRLRPLRAALRRGGADNLSLQYRNGTAHLLPPLRHTRLLRAALRPRSDQRQRALSGRDRRRRAEAIRVLKSAVSKARLGREEELGALKRLDEQARLLEHHAAGPDGEELIAQEGERSQL